MRTDDEIVARIQAVAKNDWLGTQRVDLLCRLPFDKAKPFLKTEADRELWTVHPRDRESVIAKMLDYMPFAWEKANNMRGISAGSSIDHYMTWIWLAGDEISDMPEYEFYGKPILARICEFYGWDVGQWDDGVRSNGVDDDE